ncbi:MAG: CDP-glucose 4,6-dehydratase [Bacteroidia bacterium]|nr:CDP-glucose 4,6-dehydratase [Bacteroidia bacterium]
MGIIKYLEKFNNKKVLITGHTGFKGSWLSIWLNMLGAEVVGIALDPRTPKDNFVLSNLRSLIKDYRCDIRDKKTVFSIIENEKPEILFHLAAQPLVLESYNNPFDTIDTNVTGTAVLLEAFRKSNTLKTAIFVTTDKVYENNEWLWPYRESDRLGGIDPYSASKAAAEIIISSYRRSFINPDNYEFHGKALASVRAGNVIGGGDWSENRLVPDCIKSIELNKTIEVRNPEAIRPWQHVLEPLGGYLLLASKMLESPCNYAQEWNFGPEKQNLVSVNMLVDAVVRYYGKGHWKISESANRLHEAKYLMLDISRAQRLLNWSPVLNFEDTIRYTVDWYKNYMRLDPMEICKQQINNYQNQWILKSEE